DVGELQPHELDVRAVRHLQNLRALLGGRRIREPDTLRVRHRAAPWCLTTWTPTLTMPAKEMLTTAILLPERSPSAMPPRALLPPGTMPRRTAPSRSRAARQRSARARASPHPVRAP